MEGGRERKRRKWDVAAPQGIPIAQASNRPGIGSAAGAPNSMAGFITAQGQQPAATAASQAPYQPPASQVNATPQPLTADIVARAKQGAAAVLEKINQDLRAKGGVGLIKPGLDEEPIRREVVINDAPSQIRYNLTRRSLQDDIARRTGTTVVVRGRYMAPGAPSVDEERPLYLKITPGLSASQSEAVQQQSVDAAAAEIETIVQGRPMSAAANAGAQAGYGLRPGGVPQPYAPRGQFRPPGQGPPSYAHVPPPDQAGLKSPVGPVPVPLYVGFEGPPDFNLAHRLRGPDDSYVKHISSSTGTSVVLKGRGAGGAYESPEPLHLFVSGGDAKGNEEAVKLAKSLIDTVRSEYSRMYPYHAPVQQHGPAGYSAPPGAPVHGQPGAPPPAYGVSQSISSYPPPAAPQAPAPANYPPPSGPANGPPAYYPPPQRPPAQAPYYPGYPPPAQPGYPAPYPHSYPPPAQQGYAQAYPGYPPHQPHQGAAPGIQLPLPVSQAASPAQQGYQAQQQGAQTRTEQGTVNGGTEEANAERRRRFKETKDTPTTAPMQPPPYAAALMGPPPPRTAQPGDFMGPPPPRSRSQSQQGSQGATATPNSGAVSGSLEGLLAYGDD